MSDQRLACWCNADAVHAGQAMARQAFEALKCTQLALSTSFLTLQRQHPVAQWSQPGWGQWQVRQSSHTVAAR